MNQYSPVHIRLALINLLGLTGVLVVNTLANTLPINGITTGELSAEYPNLFVPAGITFAIWGVIYLALVGFSVYSVTIRLQKGAAANGRTDFLGVIGPWFFISCLANMTWIIAWHHRMIWISEFLMLILLTSLIAIYIRLYIGRVVRPAEKIWVHLPFSIYLGWITVATVANITALLVHLGWSGAPLQNQPGQPCSSLSQLSWGCGWFGRDGISPTAWSLSGRLWVSTSIEMHRISRPGIWFP